MLDLYSNAIYRILKPFERPMNKLSDKAKNVGFTLGILFIIFTYFLNGAGLIEARYLYRFAFCCVMLGVIILCSIRGKLQPVKFNKILMGIWLIFGFLQLLSGIINDVNYLPEAVLFLIAFPVLFFVWGNMGIDRFFDLLINACVVSFYVFVFLCLLFSQKADGYYSGFFDNPNNLGEYMGLVFFCILFKIFSTKKNKYSLGYNLLLFASVAMVLLSNSRTGMLSVLLSFSAFVFFAISKGYFKDKTFKRRFLSIIIVGVLCSIIVVTFFMIFVLISDSGYEAANYVKRIVEVFKHKLSFKGYTLDKFTSGRSTLWAEYFKNLNLTGHQDNYAVYINRPGYDDPIRYSTCHNYALQYAINHGVLAGIIAALFVLLSFLSGIKYCRKNKSKIICLFSTVASCAFLPVALLASPCISFNYMLLLYFYFAQAPLMVDGFIHKNDNLSALN